MKKTYYTLLRENQDLRKYIKELEQSIDDKDKKHMEYVYKVEDQKKWFETHQKLQATVLNQLQTKIKQLGGA
tara:strand:+ start:436 stop:651 length:216 start_codon:yes stop_codon:yes gene_type:complete